MPKLDKALLSLNSLSLRPAGSGNAAAWLVVTILYLVAVLSLPLYAPQRTVWFAIYPVIQSEVSGVGYSKVFLKSLWVLPVIVFIGIFNPFIDTETAFSAGGGAVSKGWVSFFSILLRGLLAVQAVILMTLNTGFYGMCNAMHRIGCPKVLVTQLQFTYRYLIVIVEEAVWMDRARKARGFGRNSYPLTQWGRMIGQLLIRSYDRASRIHNAMLSRGFNGTMPLGDADGMNVKTWLFVVIWVLLFVALRFFDISSLLINL